MIHPDEALALVRSFRREPTTEKLCLASALGRIMPKAVLAGMDQPPFSKSAMDGWAWQAPAGQAMPAGALRIRGTVAAGSKAGGPLLPGQCDRIMTGAPLPEGANRVQRVEWSAEAEGCVIFSRTERESNIIGRGENSRAGSVLLSPRTLRAQDIAILAADGRSEVEVAAKVMVCVFSTGSELTEPGLALGEAMIYDSNRYQLLCQMASMPCEIRDGGILADDYESTLGAVRAALEANEVVILSGGVSMGDFDYVPAALKACGVEELFHGVAMKPGKPTFFGRSGRCFVFGLPGNPVSVFVNADHFVKPLVAALCGADYEPLTVPYRMAEAYERHNAERVEFVPVRLEADGAKAIPYGGSSALQALAVADGFIRLEIDQGRMEKGAIAHVRLVR